MSTQKTVSLYQFRLSCSYGPSSYVSRQGIYLVAGEPGFGLACASYPIGRVIVGDKVYVRIPEEYGSPEYRVWSRIKKKSLTGEGGTTGSLMTVPVHVKDDLWVISVIEAADDGVIVLYSWSKSPPKMYTAVGFNVEPLTFNEQLTRIGAATIIGGAAGAILKPINPIVSSLIGALLGAGIGAVLSGTLD